LYQEESEKKVQGVSAIHKLACELHTRYGGPKALLYEKNIFEVISGLQKFWATRKHKYIAGQNHVY